MADLEVPLRELGEHRLLGELAGIRKELDDRTLFVVTVGQFSRGKSSLINALLDRPLLPVGVEPTTALIHVLRYRKGPDAFRVIDQDAKAGTWRPAKELEEYTINRSESSEPVAWVELGIEHDLLDKGMVIVDTPGTDDMNQLRAEVVYSLIPRADALVMVLSAKSQLHSSEETFLREKLLKSVAPRMFFALNKIDLIGGDADDDEDPEDLVQEVLHETSSSLERVLPGQNLNLLPVSSKQGKVEPLMKALNDFKASGCDVFQSRGARMLDAFALHMAHEKKLSLQTLSLSEADARAAMDRLESDKKEMETTWPAFEQWVHAQGVSRILPLLHKSLETHIQELGEDLRAQSAGMSDLSAFTGEVLPRLIEKSLRSWLDRHIPELQTFANRFCKAVSVEYERHFGRTVQLHDVFAENSQMPEALKESIELESAENDMTLRVALPAAGALVAGLALSGGFAALGMLAGHLFSSKIQQERKKTQRESFQEELPLLLDRAKTDYAAQLEEKLRDFERMLCQRLKTHREQSDHDTKCKLQELHDGIQKGQVNRQKKEQQWGQAEQGLATWREEYGN
jgi:hypothetical protein